MFLITKMLENRETSTVQTPLSHKLSRFLLFFYIEFGENGVFVTMIDAS